MSMPYDPNSSIVYYNQLAEKEWLRLTATPVQEVSLYLHTHYLQQHIQRGMRVLEVGAGPGRFTQVLADLGAQVLVGDISPVQLQLNRQNAAHYRFAAAIEDWRLLDICDLQGMDALAFDAVVAYGGPLSYALNRRQEAVAACRRVLKSSGVLLCSVMSLWGTCHSRLDGVLAIDPDTNQRITASGDLTPRTDPNRKEHFMHMYRSAELRALLQEGGFTIRAISACGVLAPRWEKWLAEQVRPQPARWGELLRMELEASAEPAALDMGTHLIAVAAKS